MKETASVLIADDDPITRSFLRQLLEEAGFQVIGEAESGQESVHLATKLHPDVLLLDLLMPIYRAWTPFETLRRRPCRFESWC